MGLHLRSFKYYQKCAQLDSKNVGHISYYAQCLFDLARYEESLNAINKSLELSPNYSLAVKLKGMLKVY